MKAGWFHHPTSQASKFRNYAVLGVSLPSFVSHVLELECRCGTDDIFFQTRKISSHEEERQGGPVPRTNTLVVLLQIAHRLEQPGRHVVGNRSTNRLILCRPIAVATGSDTFLRCLKHPRPRPPTYAFAPMVSPPGFLVRHFSCGDYVLLRRTSCTWMQRCLCCTQRRFFRTGASNSCRLSCRGVLRCWRSSRT